jgi:hypothetical protein
MDDGADGTTAEVAAVDAGLGEHERDALVQRVGLIEDQPLPERADAYARIHAELQAHLEGSDERR